MKYRQIANSDLSVSEVGFGVWTVATSWWGEHTNDAAIAMLREARDLGINFFDTAATYGEGRGETLLRDAFPKGERADVVIATNESVRDNALDRGGQVPDDVFVVRTAPKIADTSVEPDASLKKGRHLLVGYVCVMGNADGVRYIVEAAHHLVHGLGRDDIQLLLMGSGPEHDNLVALRDELGLGDFIDMPGRVTNEFLFTALRTMELGVSSDPINPYNDHSTMNKVLEYMTFAKPQVMFDLKEGRFSAGDAARYVGENSAQALGRAIADLLDDPGECERMGRLGQARFRSELNWEKSVDQLKAAYARALGQG